MLGLFGVICAINVPNLLFRLAPTFNFDSKTNTSTIIEQECKSTKMILLVRNTVASLFRILLPVSLQFIFSFLLISNIFRVSRSVSVSRTLKREYRFAKIIVWLSLLLLMTETPLLIATLYFTVLSVNPSFPLDARTSHSLGIATLVYFCALTLSLYMFGSLFYVNLFVNKVFQNEIKLIIGFQGKSHKKICFKFF